MLRAADCRGCGSPSGAEDTDATAGSFAPNPFGLHDMGGGVEQWVADSGPGTTMALPRTDPRGIGRTAANGPYAVVRGSGMPTPSGPRNRNFYDPTVRYPSHGLRVVQSPATAPARLPLPAPARVGEKETLESGRCWSQPCGPPPTVSLGRSFKPIALGYARQKSWGEAVETVSDECKSLRSRLVAEHDRLYGAGTGKRFFEGRYAVISPGR